MHVSITMIMIVVYEEKKEIKKRSSNNELGERSLLNTCEDEEWETACHGGRRKINV